MNVVYTLRLRKGFARDWGRGCGLGRRLEGARGRTGGDARGSCAVFGEGSPNQASFEAPQGPAGRGPPPGIVGPARTHPRRVELGSPPPTPEVGGVPGDPKRGQINKKAPPGKIRDQVAIPLGRTFAKKGGSLFEHSFLSSRFAPDTCPLFGGGLELRVCQSRLPDK